MSIIVTNSFEVVYYSFPVPTNPMTVSLLGILFDKIYLPGLFLPKDQDKKLIQERIRFLVERYDPQDSMSAQREMIATLTFVEQYGELLGLFEATGKEGFIGVLEPETEPVVKELEQLIYGPPPPNFTPTPNMGFNQPAGNSQINGPSWISYPANALVYSRKNNLPLISDTSLLPFPNVPITLSQADANTLASYLLAASFSLILPRIRPLHAEEILEVREKMRDDIGLFRAAMLSCVEEYIKLVNSNPSPEQLEKQAKYIAQTHILPKAEHLKSQFESPKDIALKKLLDLTLEAPELLLTFQNQNEWVWGVIKVFSSVAKKLEEGIHQYHLQQKTEKSSGLSLLLKVQRRFPK